MIILTYLLFFVTCIFSFYIPGKVFIDNLKLTLKPLESMAISWFVGISLFLLGTYIFSWLGIPQVYLFSLVIINIIFFKSVVIDSKFFKKERVDLISTLIIVLGSLSFLYSMFFSGLITEKGIQFLGVNSQDGIRHLAYIKTLVFTFPPQHPALSGVDLKGFHYFYDFMLAKFSQFFLFSAEDLYFRLFPLLISILYGLSFHQLSQKLTNNINARRLILFFAYFAQSFSFIFILFNKNVDLTSSPIVHPIGLIINPFIVLAIGMLVSGLALLPEVRKSYKYAITIGLIFGVLSQIKVYAGIIAIGTISFYFLYILLRYRRKYLINHILLLGTTALITAVTFLPNNFRQGGLGIFPFEFYRHYISSHGFEIFQWDLRRMVFAEHNNYPRLLILYLEAIVIFWIYNLGVLSIVLLKFRDIFKKNFWSKDYNFILFSSIVIPIFITSSFLQSISAFDTVQFLWIVIPLTGIPAGIIFARFFGKNRLIGIIILLSILAVSIPGNLDFIFKYSPLNKNIVVDRSQVEFYKKIGNVVPDDNFLVYIPDKKVLNREIKFYNTGVPLIAALSGKQVYLEGGNLPGNLDEIFEERYRNIINLNNVIEKCDLAKIDKYLNIIGSKYILSENYYLCLKKSSFFEMIGSAGNTLYIYQ